MRNGLGPTPRAETPACFQELDVALWRRHGSVLRQQMELQHLVATEGEVVWGAVVHANPALYEARNNDLWGEVVFSFDPWFESRPAQLMKLAQDVHELSGATDTLPDLPLIRRAADRLRGTHQRFLSWLLPPQLTRYRRVWVSSFIVERAHLPNEKLVPAILPVVALRSGPIRPVRVVPSVLWPAQVHSMWARHG